MSDNLRSALAVLLVSIPAAFFYAAIWLTETDLAPHEQLSATGGLVLGHLLFASLAAAAARGDL